MEAAPEVRTSLRMRAARLAAPAEHAGAGWVQEWDKPRHALRTGDVVWIALGVKRWHGAQAMDGSPVTWLEQVTDAQYEER